MDSVRLLSVPVYSTSFVNMQPVEPNVEQDSENEDLSVSVVAKFVFQKPAPAPKNGKKGRQAGKPKKESKAKDMKFVFRDEEDNYVLFMKTMLEKHHLNDLAPLVKKTRVYPMKIQVPPAK